MPRAFEDSHFHKENDVLLPVGIFQLLPIDFCLRSLMHCKYLETVHVPIGIKGNRLLSKNEIFLLRHSF